MDRLARVTALAGADHAALVTLSEDGAHVTASLGDLSPADWPERIGAGVMRRVAKDGDPAAIDPADDVADDKGTFAAALLLPTRTDPPFVVALFRRSRGFADDEIARHAALAALLADLFEEGRAKLRAVTQLERLEERVSAHEELHPAFASARDPTELLNTATQAIAERFHAEAASVMLLDPNGELRVRASVGLPPEVARQARRRVGEGIAGWVVESRRGVLLRGPVNEARFRGVDPEAGAALSVPLRIGDDVVGVLNVKRPRQGILFTESHLQVLEGIAADVATALHYLDAIQRLEDDRRRAVAMAEIARLAQAGDRRTAARLACEALGYGAIGVATADGVELLYAAPGRTLDAESAVRVRTSAGQVLLFAATSGETAEDVAAIAERVAPLLAAPETVSGPVRPGPGGSIRVFVVDDHPIVREGLRVVLERDGDLSVCGSASTLHEAVVAVEELRPAVVVCDLHLPDADDVEAVRRIAAAAPHTPIVVFSVEASAEVAAAALRAGARGFVPKRASPDEVRAAVRAAAAGLLAVHPDLAAALETRPNRGEIEPKRHNEGAPREQLTPRELEYLRYLAEGYTNKEIASRMVLAEDTVKKGIQTLIAKLGAADRTHAVVIALREDLID